MNSVFSGSVFFKTLLLRLFALNLCRINALTATTGIESISDFCIALGVTRILSNVLFSLESKVRQGRV